MKRITVSLDDDVVSYIQRWRGKALMHGVEKSFSQCVNELCKEIVRKSKV